MYDLSFDHKHTTGNCLTQERPDITAYRTALSIFNAQHQNAVAVSWINRLLRRPECLLDLDTAKAGLAVRGSHDAGIQPVMVSQIVGSEGRHCAFDRSFRPLHGYLEGRWVGICMLMLLHAYLPAVELIQVGDAYFVRDGNHRVSVARALGLACLDARVTVLDTVAAPASAEVYCGSLARNLESNRV